MKKFALLFPLAIFPLMSNPVVGLSALLHENQQKGVLLVHDAHVVPSNVDYSARTIEEQKKELKEFIDTLSNQCDPTSFFIEYPSHAESIKNFLPDLIVNIPVKNALAHRMKHASLAYTSFDQRNDQDIWNLTTILNPKGVLALSDQQSSHLPQDFETFTVGRYKSYLQEQKKRATLLLKSLPPALQLLGIKKLSSYQYLQQLIEEYSQQHSIKDNHHMLALSAVVHYAGEEKFQRFLNTFQEAQSVTSDLTLWYKVRSSTNPLTVVHAGAFHTHHLQKALYSEGYKDMFGRDYSEGLDGESPAVRWPAKLPSSLSPVFKKVLTTIKNIKRL